MFPSQKEGESVPAADPSFSRRVRRRASGQTLISVLVSLFILTTGILSTLALSLGSGRVTRQSHLRSVAYAAARQEMESLRAVNFDSRVSPGNVPVVATFDLPGEVEQLCPQAQMKGDYVVVPLSKTLQQVTIQVSWLNPASGFHQPSSMRLNTLIAKEPGQ
jgi:hypothetical protein